jgi:predicted amidohydrolase/NH3-dependent NAD+ synthetase
MISITLAQLNVTVGDMDGNVRKMVAAAQRARDDGADLVVFSELSLTGYYPGDLLDEPHFRARVDAGFEALLQASRQMPALHWVIGMPAVHAGPGKPLRNVLRVVRAGEVLLEYAKQLLPSYNIFNERRHFEPGPDVAKVLRIGSAQVGFLICEDGWNDDSRGYAVNPFERLRDAAPDLVVSINASPSNIGKREQRHQVFGAASRRHGLPILYVNQVGGHDQLVYDGASFAVEPKAGVVFEAQRFVEDVRTLRFEASGFRGARGEALPAVSAEGLPTMAFYRQQIVLGLRDYARRCGFTQAVIGSSGGIDSAITLALAAEAFGPDRVTAVTMPSVFSSAGSVDDSQALCDGLGMRLHRTPLLTWCRATAAASTPLRRTAAGPGAGEPAGAHPRHHPHGIFQHLGPPAADHRQQVGDVGRLLHAVRRHQRRPGPDRRPLQDRGVRAGAPPQRSRRTRVIPAAIIEKPPSAELAPDQKDTDSLPPYEVLDEVLKHLIEGHGLAREEGAEVEAFVARLQQRPEGAALVDRVRRLVARSEYKRRQAPPVIRVRARAFGSGRQMPIAAQHF